MYGAVTCFLNDESYTFTTTIIIIRFSGNSSDFSLPRKLLAVTGDNWLNGEGISIDRLTPATRAFIDRGDLLMYYTFAKPQHILRWYEPDEEKKKDEEDTEPKSDPPKFNLMRYREERLHREGNCARHHIEDTGEE